MLKHKLKIKAVTKRGKLGTVKKHFWNTNSLEFWVRIKF